MKFLYESLSQRKRPEDIADHILTLLKGQLDRSERAVIERAAKGALRRSVWAYTSMLQDFARPVGLQVQVGRARVLFGSAYELTAEECSDAAKVERFIRHISPEIHKAFGQSDFMHDRMNREIRKASRLDISRRKYNRKFRFLARLERKLGRLIGEYKKLDFTRVGKSGLASRLTWEDFSTNANSACFIAYYTARCSLRSEFTVSGQQRPFDQISHVLFPRCTRDPNTNWWAIAHVYPAAEVLERLRDEQKGQLLSQWFKLLEEIAGLLRDTWARSDFNRRTMVVQRGDDSTTWNNTASAWNTARGHWIALLQAMGMDSMLDAVCPGKVLRLMAADVVMWHQAVGGGLDPDTAVWAELPPPWEVLSGARRCGRSYVESVCHRHGVKPSQRGWTAPRPRGAVSEYRPTPELVHGVTVANPHLATVLRGAGWYSGKTAKSTGREWHGVYGAILGNHRASKEAERNKKTNDLN